MISVLTLTQYVFQINLHIDQLFNYHFVSTKTSHLGRMAPNTALCFLLSGVAVALLVLQKERTMLLYFTLGIILFSIVLSMVALLGYVGQIPSAYGWGYLTRMALHTSVCFIIINDGLAIQLWVIAKDKLFLNRKIQPFLAFFATFFIFSGFWLALAAHNEKNMYKIIQYEGDFSCK